MAGALFDYLQLRMLLALPLCLLLQLLLELSAPDCASAGQYDCKQQPWLSSCSGSVCALEAKVVSCVICSFWILCSTLYWCILRLTLAESLLLLLHSIPVARLLDSAAAVSRPIPLIPYLKPVSVSTGLLARYQRSTEPTCRFKTEVWL